MHASPFLCRLMHTRTTIQARYRLACVLLSAGFILELLKQGVRLFGR